VRLSGPPPDGDDDLVDDWDDPDEQLVDRTAQTLLGDPRLSGRLLHVMVHNMRESALREMKVNEVSGRPSEEGTASPSADSEEEVVDTISEACRSIDPLNR
jgi:hypothetical protein